MLCRERARVGGMSWYKRSQAWISSSCLRPAVCMPRNMRVGWWGGGGIVDGCIVMSTGWCSDACHECTVGIREVSQTSSSLLSFFFSKPLPPAWCPTLSSFSSSPSFSRLSVACRLSGKIPRTLSSRAVWLLSFNSTRLEVKGHRNQLPPTSNLHPPNPTFPFFFSLVSNLYDFLPNFFFISSRDCSRRREVPSLFPRETLRLPFSWWFGLRPTSLHCSAWASIRTWLPNKGLAGCRDEVKS